MKTNEAPDKIYLQVCGDCPQTDCVTCKFEDLEGVTWDKDRIFPKDVEYTRTDAFIEKAVNFLNCSLSGVVAIKNGNTTQGLLRTKSEFVESFKKYMKGE